MTPIQTARTERSTMVLAVIRKPDKFDIALASMKVSEALPVDDHAPLRRRPVSSVTRLDELPDSWTRGGLNE